MVNRRPNIGVAVKRFGSPVTAIDQRRKIASNNVAQHSEHDDSLFLREALGIQGLGVSNYVVFRDEMPIYYQRGWAARCNVSRVAMLGSTWVEQQWFCSSQWLWTALHPGAT